MLSRGKDEAKRSDHEKEVLHAFDVMNDCRSTAEIRAYIQS